MRDAYLKRIDYSGDLTPTAANLCALQHAHLLAVPFENLDIPWGRRIELDRAALIDKVITRRRGGFCHEVNGLFSRLLTELGYEVTNLSARVDHGEGDFGLPFEHLALCVRCPADALPEEMWLVDVGFGDTFRDPLRILPNIEQRQGQRTYWLQPTDEGLILHQREWDGTVERHYIFTLEGHDFAEFEPRCDMQQTSPDSVFTCHRIITLALPNGRITLRDNAMTRTEGTQKTTTDFAEEAFPNLLRQHFAIEAPHVDPH